MDTIFVNYSDEEIWKANKKPPLHLNRTKNRKRIRIGEILYQICFVISTFFILVTKQV